MKSKTVHQSKQRLEVLFKRIASMSGDLELQSHWARYLCVLVSGFIETSIRAIYSEYATNRSAPSVANYVEAQLKWFQNAKMGKIIELAALFNPAWASELEVACEGAPKDAIDSIVTNRHHIAHGRSTGITYHRIKEYYDNAMFVIELVDEQCNR